MSSENERHLYDVTISWKNGKIGSAHSPHLDQSLEIATPPEFPGGVERIWSPEHLFTASVSSCFMTSFTAIAEYSSFEFDALDVRSSGVMEKENGKFMMSKIILKPTLRIRDVSSLKKAYRLLEKAEQICLITRSIKSEIEFEPQVEIITAGESVPS